MSDDDLVGEITVYYRPPDLDGGHVYVEVRDQRTEESYHLDIGPSQIGLGVLDLDRPYEAVVTGRDRDLDGDGQVDQLDDSRRTEHHSATWGITEAQLEGAIQAIEERLDSSTGYHLTNASCVDATREVLEAAGYNLPDRWLPSSFWNDIQRLPETHPDLFTSPDSLKRFDGGVDRGIDIRYSPSSVDFPEDNFADGEYRYVPPHPTVSDPNISGSEQNATPSNANTCSPDGHEIHIDSPESKQSFTQPDANMSSSDGYEVRADSSSSMSSPASYDPGEGDDHAYTPSNADYTDEFGHSTHEGDSSSSSSMSSPASYDPGGGDDHAYTPSNADYTDEFGHSTHEGDSSSSSSMSSPASYDPGGGDDHDYTPSDANYTDDLGHSTHEGDSSSSSSMSSSASYDPGGNSAYDDASRQDDHDSSEGYEDNSAYDDASRQDDHDSSEGYEDNSAYDDASRQDDHDSSEGYEDNSAYDDASRRRKGSEAVTECKIEHSF
jgi:hypothetical protein